MRKASLFVIFALTACGGTTTTPTDAGNDASSSGDTSTGGDSSNGDGASNDGGVATDGNCGTVNCTSQTQACCVDPGNGGTPTFTCVATGGAACPQGAIELQCSSAASCASTDVCCADPTVDPIVAQCKPTCAPGEAMLCNPAASDSINRCGDAGACSSVNVDTWNLPPSYGTCGGVMN